MVEDIGNIKKKEAFRLPSETSYPTTQVTSFTAHYQ